MSITIDPKEFQSGVTKALPFIRFLPLRKSGVGLETFVSDSNNRVLKLYSQSIRSKRRGFIQELFFYLTPAGTFESWIYSESKASGAPKTWELGEKAKTASADLNLESSAGSIFADLNLHVLEARREGRSADKADKAEEVRNQFARMLGREISGTAVAKKETTTPVLPVRKKVTVGTTYSSRGRVVSTRTTLTPR